MLRFISALAIAAVPLPSAPVAQADFQICATVHNGTVVHPKGRQPGNRAPLPDIA